MQFPIISCTQKIVIYETKANLTELPCPHGTWPGLGSTTAHINPCMLYCEDDLYAMQSLERVCDNPPKDHPAATLQPHMSQFGIERYYVVGSNNMETRFRVLKIDRTEPKDLHIVDDKVEYTRKEIRDLLVMIDVGNRPKVSQKGSTGLARTVSAFGIVGFVRFLEGYYIVLITKRRKVSLIGHHTIYKIEDTSMVYIPHESVRYIHPDEQRYYKMFQNVDLSSNFYFSYSYDVTHTLQYNLTSCKGLESSFAEQTTDQKHKFSDRSTTDTHVHAEPHPVNDVEDATRTLGNFLEEQNDASRERINVDVTEDNAACKGSDVDERFVYGVRPDPTWKYVWNLHMLKKVRDELYPGWVLYIVHGFIGQSNISVHGRSVYLTLISRRSNLFAGTRFLKRGANAEGHVANEVETEQIVHDASILCLHRAKITSFVQLRGSLPLHWSQDISKMVPKPSITLDQADPYAYVAGLHFNQVFRRYGAPVIILNLVKRKENKRHESILSKELVSVLQYLNQFLPPKHSIKYISFDMARVSKNKDANVLRRLAEIAESCVKKTGFFQNFQELYSDHLRPHPRCRGLPSFAADKDRKQLGVVRTNCVDCLDRTNTAQFAIGKCALGLQLHCMGLIDNPDLEFDTDCVRMLEDLYEDQGDTLAVQYGGSQLVHRIKGYRKIAPWTSSSRDIIHTLSRYYSNAFSDADKQNAINLFLGMFVPKEGQLNIWELTTDFYLHNPVTLQGPLPRERSYCQWWDYDVIKCLPYACEEVNKGLDENVLVIKTHPSDERIDGFWEYYKPFELTTLDELYCFSIPNSVRDFMPKFSSSRSPFALRVRPGRRQEEFGCSTTEANPNVSGKDSTSSTASTGSESTSSSDGSDIEGDIDILDVDYQLPTEDSTLSLVSLKDLFPTMAQTYGVELAPPNKVNNAVYKRYVHIGKNAMRPIEQKADLKAARKATNLIQKSIFRLDSSYHVEPPKVHTVGRDIYETYVRRGKEGADLPSKRDMKTYHEHLLKKYI